MAYKINGIDESTGKITYSAKVLLNTILIAAKEIQGVAGLCNIRVDGAYKKNVESMKGIRMELKGLDVYVDVYINVYANINVPTVAFKVQENIKRNIESTTPFIIKRVDVHVMGVVFDTEEASKMIEV